MTLPRGVTNESLFWSKVEKTDGCWWYLGALWKGYGQYTVKRRNWRAHRYSFFLTYGRMPGPLLMHECNNRACVRPAHLIEGTQKQNIEQAVRQGRMSLGSRNGSAKLTEEDVKQVWVMRAAGLSQQAIGDAFGVSQKNISLILARKKWQHVAPPVRSPLLE